MKTAHTVTLLPITRAARPPTRPAASSVRRAALRIVLGAAMAVAAGAAQAIRASAARAQGAPHTGSVASDSSSGAGPGSAPMRAFRDDAPCDLVGEPVECR
jgi:hypothetical protein